VADEREIVQSQGIDYVHIPVDFRHPSMTALRTVDTYLPFLVLPLPGFI